MGSKFHKIEDALAIRVGGHELLDKAAQVQALPLNEAVHAAREIFERHCSKAEVELLITRAVNAPIPGSTPAESVTALAVAIQAKPEIKNDLVEMARMSREDHARVIEIQRWASSNLPRFNVGFPHTSEELAEVLRALLSTMWPDAHESCINGALMAGAFADPDAEMWVLKPLAMVRSMRQTAEADRAMRCGYGA